MKTVIDKRHIFAIFPSSRRIKRKKGRKEEVNYRMNDIRGVVRAVRKWNIGRIKFNPAVQREIIVGGLWYPAITMIDFRQVTKYWIDQKKKKKGKRKKEKLNFLFIERESANRTIHFQFSTSFYRNVHLVYTKLTSYRISHSYFPLKELRYF